MPRKKPLKNPNGFGTVVFIGKNRRKPYGARVTVGWEKKEDGTYKQKYKYISYHETREEALISLAKYKENPYDLEVDTMTFKDVYDKWSADYFASLKGDSSKRSIISAYKHSEFLHNKIMKSITTYDLEETIKNADVGDATKSRMKSLYNLMYGYAMAHDIVDKDYAHLCFSSTPAPYSRAVKRQNIVFSDDEIKLLWDNVDKIPFADMILIGIYSGFRPQELAILKIADIDLENGIIKGGMKTEAGTSRLVPILSVIDTLIRTYYDKAIEIHSEYLFNDLNGQQGYYMTYDKYRHRFDKVMDSLKLNHHPHETRHTFISMAKEVEMDDNILKLIVGHAINDVTEKVYTHRKIEQIKAEMNKILK